MSFATYLAMPTCASTIIFSTSVQWDPLWNRQSNGLPHRLALHAGFQACSSFWTVWHSYADTAPTTFKSLKVTSMHCFSNSFRLQTEMETYTGLRQKVTSLWELSWEQMERQEVCTPWWNLGLKNQREFMLYNGMLHTRCRNSLGIGNIFLEKWNFLEEKCY